MPGTVALSHQFVCAGRLLAPDVATPSFGRSSTGQTKPVAATTSSHGTASSDPPTVKATLTRNVPSSRRSTPLIEASRIDTPPPKAVSSKGWTYRARTPTSEWVSREVFAGDGEARTI